MAKKTDGRVERPDSAQGAEALASNGLLSAYARDELDLTMLTREQQLLFGIAAVRQEVNSGGFASYFSTSWNILEPITPEALRIVGDNWAELFLEAQEVADGLDRDADALADSKQLKALDKRFVELEGSTNADGVLDAWVGWNRDAIFRKKGPFGLW
jgi:hypothetical protein